MEELKEIRERLKKYEILHEIGKGSFATVYKARDKETGEIVAVKAIDLQKLNKSERLVQNLKLEISIQKMIHHPNVVQLKDIIVYGPNKATGTSFDKTDDQWVYLVMEFCNHGDLGAFFKRLKQNSSFSLNEDITKKFLSQIGQALGALKSMNFIHRDIKPQNILLSSIEQFNYDSDLPVTHADLAALQLKLGDFGFARYMSNFDMAETLCGSPLYMAPEILSYKKYNYKVDLWSVGCIAYELVFGHPPYRASNHISLLKKMKAFPIELVIQHEKKNISLTVKSLLTGLLQYDPSNRFTFDAFISHEFFKGTQHPTPVPPAVAIPIAKDTRATTSNTSSDVMDQMSQILINTKLTTRRYSASSLSSAFKPSTYTAPGIDAYFHGRPSLSIRPEDSSLLSLASDAKFSPLFHKPIPKELQKLHEEDDKDYVVVTNDLPSALPPTSPLKRTMLSIKRASFTNLPFTQQKP